MRALIFTLVMGLLTACSQPVPDSAAGVGFNNSLETQQAREAALSTGQPFVPPAVLSDETGSFAQTGAPLVASPNAVSSQPLPTGAGSSADIAAETAAALAAINSNSGQVPLQASPSNPSPQATAGISNENDFAAVSERQSIASDAERIAQNKAQYQVVTPTALPTRTSGSQPNIVEYALSTSNPRGTRVYSRSSLNGAAKATRNCAKYASPDLAQMEFLSSGGPQKDRKGLDPDGDGYACSWDPGPFRRAANN